MRNDLTVSLIVDERLDPAIGTELERRGLNLIARAGSVEELFVDAPRTDSGVVVIGPRPRSTPEQDVVEVRRRAPHLSVIVLADPLRELEFLSVLSAGAVGYLPATLPAAKLAAAVAATFHGEAAVPRHLVARLVAEFGRGGGHITLPATTEAGRVRLSDREWQVVCHLRQRLSTREIADEMFISQATVRTHIASLVRKLGASGRDEALMMLEGAGQPLP